MGSTQRPQAGQPNIRRQHPVGRYVLDFYYPQVKLGIEIDGAHHAEGNRPESDAERDAYLNSLGIRVMRIQAADVLRDPGAVAAAIVSAGRTPPQSSGPRAR